MMDLLAIVPYYDGHLCAALDQEQNLEVTLGAITYAYDQGYFRRQGVRNRPGLDLAARLKLPRSVRRPIKTLEGAFNLAALAIRISSNRPDVLHVQFLPMMEMGIPFECWVLRLARRLGIKIVHTVHNVLPPDTIGRRRANAHANLYGAVYRSADGLICHDERAKARLMEEFAVRPERIWVIPHGPLFREACSRTREESRLKLQVPRNKRLVLWQGILDRYKGVGFLLEAWSQLIRSGCDAQLAIVGSGSREILESVRRRIAELGICSSVRQEPKFVSVEELGYWYRAADILVYPYSEATTSGALMTGINYETAIVATTIPAFQEILKHNENSLLVDYGDVQGLADALRRLVLDDALRLRLSERARELRSSSPSWQTIAGQTRACYEEVVHAERTI